MIKNVLFLVFFMYYLCEKHYKPITVNKYYIVSCLSLVPKLMLLEL